MSLGVERQPGDRRFDAVESARFWGMNRLALRRCRKALAGNPGDARLRARLVFLEVATRSKSAERAVEELRQMENPPQDPLMTKRWVASCWWVSGDRDRAVGDLRRILAERDDAASRCRLGGMLEAKKDHGAAWEEFKQSEHTEGFPCRRHVGSAISAARGAGDRTGAVRLLAKMDPIHRLSFKLSGPRTEFLPLLLAPLVTFSVHWSVFDSWSPATHLFVAGAAVAAGLGVLAIQMLAARHHWIWLLFPPSLILMGLGGYLLGLQNRPGPPIAYSFILLGWVLVIDPVLALWFIVRRAMNPRRRGPLASLIATTAIVLSVVLVSLLIGREIDPPASNVAADPTLSLAYPGAMEVSKENGNVASTCSSGFGCYQVSAATAHLQIPRSATSDEVIAWYTSALGGRGWVSGQFPNGDGYGARLPDSVANGVTSAYDFVRGPDCMQEMIVVLPGQGGSVTDYYLVLQEASKDLSGSYGCPSPGSSRQVGPRIMFPSVGLTLNRTSLS